MADPTPRPWRLVGTADVTAGLNRPALLYVSASGCSAPTWAGKLEEARANAAYVVRVVNLHDRLVAALEEITVGLQQWLEDNGDTRGRIAGLLGMAHDALAAAGGRPS